MSPLGTLQTALSSIGANRLRAGLALLGIVIGVTAVISLMSIGRGAQEAITSRIESLGTNLLFVQPGASTQGGVSGALGSAGTLTRGRHGPGGPGLRPVGGRGRSGDSHSGAGCCGE